MKSYAEHVQDLAALLPPRAPVWLPVPESLGLILTAEIRSGADLPSFASSAMDGYAVRVRDVPGTLTVGGEVAAGSVPHVAVAPGVAVRVMTGSMLPGGTEAVVPVEETRLHGALVLVTAATRPGAFLRAAGGDLRAGEVVVRAGQRMGPAQIAAAIAAGAQRVQCQPRLRVAVLSTGDEVVPLGAAPGPAQLVDSNGPGLIAAAMLAGVSVRDAGLVGDDATALLAALDAVAHDVDLIVTSGGVSMGDYDVVKSALAGRGVRFEQVAVQPGRPQGWGYYGPGGPAFIGLPGNPVSALVCFEIFVRVALGCPRPVLAARLGQAITGSPRGRRQFLRGRYADSAVHPEGGAASHLVAGMARSDCLIVVDEDVTDVSAGELVAVMSLEP